MYEKAISLLRNIKYELDNRFVLTMTAVEYPVMGN